VVGGCIGHEPRHGRAARLAIIIQEGAQLDGRRLIVRRDLAQQGMDVGDHAGDGLLTGGAVCRQGLAQLGRGRAVARGELVQQSLRASHHFGAHLMARGLVGRQDRPEFLPHRGARAGEVIQHGAHTRAQLGLVAQQPVG